MTNEATTFLKTAATSEGLIETGTDRRDEVVAIHIKDKSLIPAIGPNPPGPENIKR